MKDRECIKCERFFECEGKAKEVKRCLNFKERKQKNSRQEVGRYNERS